MAPRSNRWSWPIATPILGAAYLLFIGNVSLSEAWAAGAVIAAGLLVAYLQHAHALRPLSVGAPWRRIGAAVPASLLFETFTVGRALLRSIIKPVTSKINVQPFDPGDDGAASAGRRAAVILAASLAPNAYVIRVTQEALLMHQLVPVPDKTDRTWPL